MTSLQRRYDESQLIDLDAGSLRFHFLEFCPRKLNYLSGMTGILSPDFIFYVQFFFAMPNALRSCLILPLSFPFLYLFTMETETQRG